MIRAKEGDRLIHSAAVIITFFLFKNNLIHNKEKRIAIYGFEILFSSILNIVLAIVIGALFHQLIDTIIFVAILIFARSFCGGYHADTYLKCNIIFCGNLCLVLILSRLLTGMPIRFFLLLWLVIFAIITIYAPIENKYKSIDSIQKRIAKKISVILCGIVGTISIMLMPQYSHIAYILFLTYLSIVFMMIIEIQKKGGNKT